MILNGITSIKDIGKDYIGLVDFGLDGIRVFIQFETIEDAIKWITENSLGRPCSIVKLIRGEFIQEGVSNGNPVLP